jgi:hypothetical protein
MQSAIGLTLPIWSMVELNPNLAGDGKPTTSSSFASGH